MRLLLAWCDLAPINRYQHHQVAIDTTEPDVLFLEVKNLSDFVLRGDSRAIEEDFRNYPGHVPGDSFLACHLYLARFFCKNQK